MERQKRKLNLVKARRRVRMRSALLLTLGVCFAMALYRVLNSLNSMGIIWPTHVFGVLLEALVSLLVFGGAAYLGLCVLDGDQRKILPRGTLSRAQTLWLTLTGVLLAAPMTLGVDVLEALFVRHGSVVQPMVLRAQAPGMFLLAALKSALLVPVLEELFFRGYLLHALGRFGPARAAAVSALCFALVHLGGKGGTELAGVMYALMGLLLAGLTLHTGSLLAPILVHAVYNLTLMLLSEMGLGWFFENLSLLSCVLRLGLCVLFVVCLRRSWKARGTAAQLRPMERLTKSELALVAAAAVLALAAGVLG